MELLEFLLIGLAAGWVLGKIRRGRGYGFFGNLIIGLTGSFIGWFTKGFLNVETPNLFARLAMAVVGAVIFFLVMSIMPWTHPKASKAGEEE